MRAKILISTFYFSLMLTSCSNKVYKGDGGNNTIKDSTTIHPLKNSQVLTDVFFKGTGNEPFWGLEISEKTVKLTMIGDSLVFPYVKPVQAMDANVKLYKLQTDLQETTIQIVQRNCINSMSGKRSPYAVTVKHKNKAAMEFITMQGCGNYITNYRLSDIWVLEDLNGHKVKTDSVIKNLPYIEINSAANTFMGFAGCNNFNGKLFSENKLLRFTEIATTKKLCQPNNAETEFLKALRSATTYNIENNRLTLYNNYNELLIFKKID